ncbi:hypothetical protein D9619_002605 [Psilocybe cf. subviscida]|uniref:Uncharacterized protein n=1 Tax=Psilocybe cf. subviscida TaxID=2480587 RepID=A0A8H5AW26_9AGAR|nr:hypothetical protein D9619_002605 [Psilocybe cf. subviscida]
MLSSRPVQLPTDGVYFPTKTPSRGLKNRVENAHAMGGVAMTTNAKGGKHAILAPKTPFQPSSAQPHRLVGKDQKIILTTKRALGDKTPLPNRFGNNVFLQTPLPGLSKMNKLTQDAGRATEFGGGTPDSVQRPSSLRKHIKQPRNSGKFETPANKGNHWDISDGDIEVLETQPEVEEDSLDDLDELEYGPPNTLDLPYEPPFDFKLPDYKEVGKTLRHLAFSVYQDDVPAPPEPDIQASDLKVNDWDMLSLPALESDDPFDLARRQIAESAKPTIASRTVPTVRSARPTATKPPVAPVRTTIRTATTTATTKPSVTRPASRGQRAPSVASVKSAPSRAAGVIQKTSTVTTTRMGLSLATRTITAPSSAKHPMPATAVLKKIAPSKSTVTPSVRPTARPVAAQRPHTSTAVTSTMKSRTGAFSSAGIRTVKPAAAVPSRDEIVFLLDSDEIDDFDFKFDI